MNVRYTDMKMESSGAKDFVLRERTPTIPQLFIIIISTLLIGISVVVSVSDKMALIAILLILLGTVGWYTMLQIQRSRDLLLATEFQNSIFASALGINNKFCMIVRKDGNIVYLDRAFQDMFPDFLKQPRRSIDMLLEQGKVSRDDRKKVFSAIEQGVYEKVIFDIRGNGNKFQKIVMSVEPILRPSGFILLRGREYVETRSVNESAATSSLLSRTTITLFAYVMDSMQVGVYITGPAGNIVYCNPILEQWLGYMEGEITASNLTLQELVAYNEKKADNIEPEDFEGEISLSKKTGGNVRCFINQKIIRDDEGRMLGSTALIHHFGEDNSEMKRKLW